MGKQSKIIPLLVFKLVIVLVALDGYDRINFTLSPDAWGLLNYIVPIGFGGGLIIKTLNTYKDRNK